MSVPSKALSLTVAIGLMTGCVATTTSDPIVSVQSGETFLQEDLSMAQMPVGEAPALDQVYETERLLAASDGSPGVVLERGNGFTRLTIDNPAGAAIESSVIEDPDRLVLDMIGSTGLSAQTMPVDGDPFLRAVRIGEHDDKTRIVIDLTGFGADNELVKQELVTEGEYITVTLTDKAYGVVANEIEQTQLAKAAPDVTSIQAQAPIAAPVALEEQVSSPIVESLQFIPGAEMPSVSVSLSDAAAFDLSRTAQSEYVLTIPGAKASDSARLPQIAPGDKSGIRSIRAVEEGNAALVRMFVKPEIALTARVKGNQIIVEGRTQTAAGATDARAQLAPRGESDAFNPDELARANPTGVEAEDGSKQYVGRLISLDLQDTDIDNALRIIAEVSNLNIITNEEVTGKVTLRLIDVPWDQALDVILKTNGLDQVKEGNVIRIAPVERLRREREALLEAKRAAQNLETLQVRYIRVSYARVQDLREQVESVLSERGTVSVDERTNQLIVKDIQEGQRNVIELIKKLDLRTPQVLLETQIVEGDRSLLRDLGFQWNMQFSKGPETGNATGLNFPNSISLGGGTADVGLNPQMVNFPAALSVDAGSAITAVLDSADGSRALTARLSMLEQEGRARVVSRPQVATINNREAQIKSVEVVRVRLPDSGLSVATGSGASASGGGSTAFEEINVGITLRVTPQASPDYYVLLDIEAQSSSLGTTVVDNIPSTIEREATSAILVKSGTTFALGGVYRIEDTDRLDGVPFLKDIPFLGHLFRRSLINKSDEELIFFITPHIVEGSFDPGAMQG